MGPNWPQVPGSTMHEVQGLHSSGPRPNSSRKSSNRASKPTRNSTWTQFESTSRGGLWTATWPWSVGARLVGVHAKKPSRHVTLRLGPLWVGQNVPSSDTRHLNFEVDHNSVHFVLAARGVRTRSPRFWVTSLVAQGVGLRMELPPRGRKLL